MPRPSFARSVWLVAAATVLFHVLTSHGYGYFRDELYYLACSRHLDLGYVDHPPLVAWISALGRVVLGSSLPAIRLLPALAGGTAVALAAAIARELRGGPFAQITAALATALAPLYLSLFGILSMNGYDVVFWALGWWLLARLLDGADPRLWLAFGAVAGLGLENKVSVLFLGFGVVVGLVAAGRWRLLANRWAWLGGALAALLFAPHLVWQVIHGWPTLEFMAHAAGEKNLPISPWQFVAAQPTLAGPVPVWLAGLVWLLWPGPARRFRPLGLAVLAVLALLALTHGKPYYLGPAYTVLFAAGGVAIEAWTAGRRGATAVRAAVLVALLVIGAAIAPLAKPLLSEDAYVRYAAALGQAPGTDERHEVGRLPQFFADMHGWPELAQAVAEAFHRLPPEEQRVACVFGDNYGEAGAVDLFGPELGLPPAISGHNSYWLWGPGDCTGEVVLVIGDDPDGLREVFDDVELGAEFHCRDCMPYEDAVSVWICRRPIAPLGELWGRTRSSI